MSAGKDIIPPNPIRPRPFRVFWKKRKWYVGECGYPRCKGHFNHPTGKRAKFTGWSKALVVNNLKAHEQRHVKDAEKEAKLEAKLRS